MPEGASALVPVAALLAVVLVIVWGVVRVSRTVRIARRLMAVPPVTGSVISATVATSTVYVHSGNLTGTTSPVGRSHRTHLVETIEYPGPHGRVLRGTPVLSEQGLVDRTGMQVPVHVDPDDPQRFLAPESPQFRLAGVVFERLKIVLFVLLFVLVMGFVVSLMAMLSGPTMPMPGQTPT